MKYSELVDLYPFFHGVISRMALMLDAKIGADAAIDWAESQLKKIKNPAHQQAALGKVRAFVEVRNGAD